MERVIFHIDINHCYAQIEEMKFPELRNVPMAVGGHEETRHGIILAKNDLAKKYGIKTADSLREAYEKCPELLIIPPHYEDYVYYTEQVKNIYRRYSNQVESYGLDEAWIDYTDSVKLFGDPIAMAKRIQEEVLIEVGLTVSVGVSFNKVFAKLGSDMKKPSGLTVITKENYQTMVWPLPVEDLLYVGPATSRKLKDRGIFTIGDLANYPVEFLKKHMGVAGEVIHRFANGEEDGDVNLNGFVQTPKSVGNSVTMVHDVYTMEEVKPVLYVLVESIASRLKDYGLQGNVISISYRDVNLSWTTRQKKEFRKTDVSSEIFSTAYQLLKETWKEQVPLRAVGVSVSSLKEGSDVFQVSFFEDEESRIKDRRLDCAMDQIRKKYGFVRVQRACTKVDEELCGFNPKEDHTIHPVGYFQGRRMSK